MPRVLSPRSFLRFSLGLVAALALATLAPPSSHASARPGAREFQLEARLVAPAPGERVEESGLLLTFERGRAAAASKVVLLPRAFDPTGWTEIPEMDGLVTRDAPRGVLALSETGLEISGETTWWWTVASRDADRGTWRFGEVRSFTVIPRFTNRVEPSPYLMRGVLGAMPEERLREQREEALRARAGDSRLTTAEGTTAGPPALHIRLSAGYDFVPTESEPALPQELTRTSRLPSEAPAGGEIEAYLVQFAQSPGPDEFRAIAEAGGAVFAYVPDQAYLVRMSDDAHERMLHHSGTTWIGAWQPAYKLSPRVDRNVPTASEFEALLFPDAELNGVVQALTALGANVTRTSDNGINKLVRFSARGDQVVAAAGISGVVWIEPLVRPQLHNLNAQWVVQGNAGPTTRRIWTMGILGENQVVMTSDSGLHTTHNMFRDPLVPITTFGDYPTHRKVIAYKLGGTDPDIAFEDHAGAVYHGTHTAGTIIGNDDPVGGTSAYDGMAKNAKIYFMDISGPALANSVDPYADLNDLFLPGYVGNAGGAARITSNSWGSTVNGAYTLNSLEVDQFTWAHPDYYVAFSNGNSTADGTVGSPATAKNCSGMGGTGNGTSANLIYSSTSRGPCVDGRRKPTFCSPGQNVNSANGANTTGTQPLSGTSMASPSGTGAVVLMRQYVTEGWYPTGAKVPANGFAPSAALLKAMAINSADNGVTGYTAPDNNIGWGRVNADNVLYFTGDAKKLLLEDFTSGLATGQYVEYQVNVVDSLVPLKVSLCWTDFPGSPAASVQLVNNLNLTVSKGATTFKGNVFSGGVSATGGSYDAINVEEGVLVSVPGKGIWTVRIDAPTVPIGPQPFGLVITGGVGNGAGTLALDRAEYGSSNTVQLQIIDTNASSPLNVNVTSPTEPGGESVSLTGSSGVFTGSLTLTPALAAAANGVLSVTNGDLLTATYNDASPATSLVAKATVNFSTPVITNVRATSLGPNGTLVTWTTDRNATSRVYYGTTNSLELGSVDSTGYATSHKVLLPNTTPGQGYSYDVESVSLAGSSARDDLGGAHYHFTGKSGGDVVMLFGDPNFPRISTWTGSLTRDGYDYDVWSGSLAENPALGDLSSGLRSYRAVIWQCGIDDYPPVTDTQRGVIDAYVAGGGRLWIMGHDLGWGMADVSSPSYSAARAAWVQGTLHANYLTDPASWTTERGVVSDPISGPYAPPGGINYSQFGTGQAGDEVSINAGAGTGNYVWIDNFSPADYNVIRWESNSANGTAGTAVWGGTPTRMVSQFLEYTAMDPPFASASAIRDTVLNRTLHWLFGRAHPILTLASPNGGEVVGSGPLSISWTESVDPGQSVASRSIEYSLDSGDSWTTIITGAGASPYSWDLTGIPNSTHARVRVRLDDNGTPALRAFDASAADFTIGVSGGDVVGPVVVAGSIAANPNPIVRGTNVTLSATVTDNLTGGSPVTAAEWSFGPNPAPAGSGTAMGGTFGGVSAPVSLLINTQYFVLGTQKLWVRGQDQAGNWGAASALTARVNGTGTTDVTGVPGVSFLSQNTPNPSTGGTSITFGLARPGAITLEVFDALGRRVKRLASGPYEAGVHFARWDGRDDGGARLGAGLYFYRLTTPDSRFERRMALLQ